MVVRAAVEILVCFVGGEWLGEAERDVVGRPGVVVWDGVAGL